MAAAAVKIAVAAVICALIAQASASHFHGPYNFTWTREVTVYKEDGGFVAREVSARDGQIGVEEL